MKRMAYSSKHNLKHGTEQCTVWVMKINAQANCHRGCGPNRYIFWGVADIYPLRDPGRGPFSRSTLQKTNGGE